MSLLKPTAALFALILLATFPATLSSAKANNDRKEENRRIVLDFYDKAINQKDADAAIAHIGNRYVQHNPNAAEGPEGLRNYIAFLREKFPESHSEIKSSFVDGDYVILHVHAVRTPGERGDAIVDIFKMEDGKVVEHWDVIQPIPEKAANSNTMF